MQKEEIYPIHRIKNPFEKDYKSSIKFYPRNSCIEASINRSRENLESDCDLELESKKQKIISNTSNIHITNNNEEKETSKIEKTINRKIEKHKENPKKGKSKVASVIEQPKETSKNDRPNEESKNEKPNEVRKNEINKDENLNEESNKNSEKETKFKYEEINVANVIKRVLENNKKEAATRTRDFFSNYPHNYMNLNMNRTGQKFFIGSINGQNKTNYHNRPETDNKVDNIAMNYLEVNLNDVINWKKHEEIWNNINVLGVNEAYDKHLFPPNEFDVLVSSYIKLNSINQDKFILDDNLSNPTEELHKWKKAYKQALHRWHPDKLFALLDGLKIKDDNLKASLKKKSTVVIYNINKLFQSILEILKKIIIKRERVKA